MNRFILVVTLLLSFTISHAQYAYFPQAGTIKYDKTVHVKNLLKRHVANLEDGDFQKPHMQALIDKVPDVQVLRKKLSFSGQEYSYEHVKEDYPEMIKNLMDWGVLDYQIDSYSDLKTRTTSSFFDFAGTPILIQDSLLDVKWKITNEYRSIAGYDCRRVNGVTLDSIYVVAFYTDQIPVSAGPGGIHGLPGAILGFVVPELHYNIYATEVQLSSPIIKKNLTGRRKEKAITRQQLYNQLKSSIGQFIADKQYNLIMATMFLE